MSRAERRDRPPDAAPAVPIRTALVSTRRLAQLFPTPGLDATGLPEATRLGRGGIALRRLLRLTWARLRFRLWRHGPLPGLVLLAESRMRVRLALLKIRHRKRLRP